MRIAIINWTRLRTGGVETYLGDLMAGLARRGHELAFWHESDEPGVWEPIPLPEGVPGWWAEQLGRTQALRRLRDWRPDLLYVHIVNDLETEAELLEVAPAVYFAHGHFGTCISGSKACRLPTPVPCHRTFGWKCLLHYYPRRCGGLSPLTMWRDYRRQSRRLELLSRYAAVVVASDYVREEYLRHGLAANRLHRVPMPLHGAEGPERVLTSRAPNQPWRLLYVGRMDLLKGGGVLLAALPEVLAALKQPLHIRFAGDGPERVRWEQEANRLQARHRGLRIEFLGWKNQGQLTDLYATTDLIVVPSLLPETFGLAGPEAGLSGVPAVAFDVGGITTWLTDGLNGHLAPGDPPTPAGLAHAIRQCLSDPVHHSQLRGGALDLARRFRMEPHLDGLLPIFADVCRETPRRPPVACAPS